MPKNGVQTKARAKPKAKGGSLVPPKRVAPSFPIKLIKVKKRDPNELKKLKRAIKKLEQAKSADTSAITDIKAVTKR